MQRFRGDNRLSSSRDHSRALLSAFDAAFQRITGVTGAVHDSDPAAPASDADLIAAARSAGDIADAGDALGSLVTRHQRMVYALALSLVREPADARDVVQEAFLRAFRNLDLLADPSRFAVWLRRIAFGVSIDHVRAERARLDRLTRGGDGGIFEAAGGDDLDTVADGRPSPLEQVELMETTERVLAELDRLPGRYRVPFTLFHLDGLSHAKVAAALGVSEGTTRSLVARARRKLMTLLAHLPEIRDMADEAGITNALDVFDAPPDRPPRMLHVLNGDVVQRTMQRSEIPGAFSAWADVLHEGPVPRITDTPAWRDTRARFIASYGHGPYADALRTYETWDAQLARFGEYDEVVMWFEHDLFDQLLLVRHLDWFARRPLGATRLSLICVGEFPGFADFHGLGQLDADQLASLLGTREQVSPRQLETGRRVWNAFTSADPTELDSIVRLPSDDDASLPFLRGALRRFVEDYPSVANGLPRTERHILECLEDGPVDTVRLFRLEQAREDAVFMGDWTFWTRVRALAAGPSPLVHLDIEPAAGPDIAPGTASITDAGRDVLRGRADWVALAGFNRWLGGVHLRASLGGDVAWRYDSRSGRIVRR